MEGKEKKKFPYGGPDTFFAVDLAARLTSPKGTPESDIEKKRVDIGLMAAVFGAAVILVLIIVAVVASYIIK